MAHEACTLFQGVQRLGLVIIKMAHPVKGLGKCLGNEMEFMLM